ncbi:MAG TPA: hypothetical protein VJN18_08715, partial [Polyangiaceae bacterium]|nr:hypothetical protein [Polyangiaceae bacterium]
MLRHCFGLLLLLGLASGCTINTGQCGCLESPHSLQAATPPYRGPRHAPEHRSVRATNPAAREKHVSSPSTHSPPAA